MHRNVATSGAALPLLVGAVMLAGGQMAQAQNADIQRKLLLAKDLPVKGWVMIVNMVEIPPGVSEVRHTHPGLLSGYIAEGTLTLESEGQPRTTYKVGESFHVDTGKIHQGINAGDVPVRIVATLVAEKAKPLSSPAP
jgi:quercetin dioxygenase-like cupin family protein